MIVDYDTSEEHLACSVSSDQNSAQNNTVNLIVSSMLGGFSKWDSVYFLDIATHGYRFEQNMAFFPLFPTLLYTFSLTLQPFKLILNLTDKSLLLLASTFLNTLSFVVASMGLFCLTNSLFKNPKLAKNVVVLFCVNPSSVFFTATYSESVFAMTQFWGMFFVERNELFIASLIFSLGSATRSNGVISCGFICYTTLKNIAIPYRDAKSKDRITSLKAIARNLLKTFMFLAIILLPFVIFQGYGYYVFCKNPLQKLKSVWCDDSLPLPYRYIQKHYWNVGFLNYYEIKQIPNFLLVLPIVVMSVWGIREYLIQQRRENVWTLGLLMPDKNNILNIFVYTVHLLFLVVFGVTSMHVQVSKLIKKVPKASILVHLLTFLKFICTYI